MARSMLRSVPLGIVPAVHGDNRLVVTVLDGQVAAVLADFDRAQLPQGRSQLRAFT